MIKSMTGYGRADWRENDKHFEVEVKSFNHRYLDMALRLPRRLSPLEARVRNSIKERISRGRIEVNVQIEDPQALENKLELDLPLARDYHQALQVLKEHLGITGEIRLETLTAFKDIFTHKETEPDLDKEWPALQKVLQEALQNLEAMRLNEGHTLREDFLTRLEAIEEMVEHTAEKAPAVLAACRDRLSERVKNLSGVLPIDPARLAQEVAFLAERSDITEEIVRIRSHLSQFREMLDDNEPMGRKLEFLLQEINREANTIASKANDARIAQVAVELKSELEKIREQVQNVE